MSNLFDVLEEVIEALDNLSTQRLIALIVICAASLASGFCLAEAVVGLLR